MLVASSRVMSTLDDMKLSALDFDWEAFEVSQPHVAKVSLLETSILISVRA